MTPQSALSQLLQIEADLSSALGHEDNDAQLEHLLSRVDAIGLKLSQVAQDGMSDVASWTQVANAVQAIWTIAVSFAEQEKRLLRRQKDVADDVMLLLQKQTRLSAAVTLPDRQHEDRKDCGQSDLHLLNVASSSKYSEQSLNAAIMRRWMLEHIDHPFPNNHDKEELAKETNRRAPSGKSQLRPEQVSRRRQKEKGIRYCPSACSHVNLPIPSLHPGHTLVHQHSPSLWLDLMGSTLCQ
ncbi:hypothetical protein BCV69DRAFT_41633 [Microstroma glucosiphilum]|uniref:KN homeodomain domain-containing protein n=1 Tax=Pseudomicrostroma glucosiphilum TaxID=1684307 RepID=A0A316U2N1_9BASI|nr:hypothetical protein BCV69DRAFT_41633 [Pseudomicrostroma glucosiphilum]PWN19497.1 hypothetical protein BCV69DRAFT_41633 [Pseudomicrostroma glucosiphilum]